MTARCGAVSAARPPAQVSGEGVVDVSRAGYAQPEGAGVMLIGGFQQCRFFVLDALDAIDLLLQVASGGQHSVRLRRVGRSEGLSCGELASVLDKLCALGPQFP